MWDDKVFSKGVHLGAWTLLLAISMLFCVCLPVSAKESGNTSRTDQKPAAKVITVGEGGDYTTFAAAFADKSKVTGNVDFVLTGDSTEDVTVPSENGITAITIRSSVAGVKRNMATVHLSGILCTLTDLKIASLNLDVSGGSDYTANIGYCDIGRWSFGSAANAPVGAVTLNINDTIMDNKGPNGHIDVGFENNYGNYTFNGPLTMNLDNVTSHSVSAINGQNLSQFTFNGPITYNLKNCNIDYVNGLVFDGSAYALSGGEVQRITANEKISIHIDGGKYLEVSGGCYKGGAIPVPIAPSEQSYIVNKGADIDIQYVGAYNDDYVDTICVGHFKNYSDADPISHYVWKGDSTLKIVSSNIDSIYGAFHTTLDGNLTMQLSPDLENSGPDTHVSKVLRAADDGGTVTGDVDLTLQGQGISPKDFGGFDSIDTGGTIKLTKVDTDRVSSMPVTFNNPAASSPPWGIGSHIVEFTGTAPLVADTFVQDWTTDSSYPLALWEQEKLATSGSGIEQSWYLGNGVKIEFKDTKGDVLQTSYIQPGDAVEEPEDSLIPGYTINGWYENQEQTGAKWDFNTALNTDKVLWAKATANQYTVTYDPNGGSGNMADQKFTYDTAQSLSPNTFIRAGKGFIGWSRTGGETNTAEFTDGQQVSNLTQGQNVTLYAVWADLAKVEYRDMDNNLIYTETLTQGQNAEAPSPVKTGYTMDGWYTSQDLARKWDFTTSVTADTVLWGKWNANQYTVAYDPNGGSGTMTDQVFTYDVPQNLEINTFTNGDKVFAGWSRTVRDANPVEFADGAEVKNLAESGRVTLYAVWAEKPPAKPVKVEYHDTGNNLLYTENLTEGQNATVPSLVKTGYTMNGWYDTQDLSGKWDFSAPVTADMVLWGQWTANPYTVTYDSNGGSGSMSDQTFTYDMAQSLTANVYTKEGKVFAGWSRTGGDENPVEFADMAEVKNLVESGNVTLYAVWEEKPVIKTVKVEFMDTDGNLVQTEYLQAGHAAAEPSPSKTGYSMNGWYEAKDLTNKWDFTTPVAEDTVLFGQWTANQYAVKFDSNGGSGCMADQEFAYDAVQKLAANAFTKKDKVFSGWSRTGGDTNTTEFENEAKVKNLVESGTVTLYAVWTDKPAKKPVIKPIAPISPKPVIKPIALISPKPAQKSPVTGDNSKIIFYALLCIFMLVLAAGVTARVIYRNRSKSDH